MVVKGFTIGLLFISLSGCASFIANQMTSPKKSNIDGNISEWAVVQQLCDSNNYCVKAIGLGELAAGDHSLEFSFHINDNNKIWRYETKNSGVETAKPLADHLILLFAGYNQPTEVLYIHQLWLQRMTGAEVIVIPSAENTETFKFGLDYAPPIVAEIQRLNPEKVHLIGFSMGALAASEVERKIDNAKLYLVAPMIDFDYSAKAIYDILYRDKIYATFISEDTLEDAIQIVYEESGTTLKDTDLIAKLNRVKSPTFIYVSDKDRVVEYSSFGSIPNENVYVNFYGELNHLEMVALLSQDLMTDFVSDLLERPVLQSEVSTLGILCDFDDDNCLNQLPD
ncbi:hypothetical protein DRW07_05320 [Alteromonas sediminis]|uniref:Alpha/beta hydrolase n=1 Tax=Alteromonas sediminis TaxID=2259342 RepID=A0A3N5YCJ3_9ALTE|nr:hypothetical protein [Alteromonas sediminis]RPJ66965.1 hypothetical protein DRW07_05320 [Alteromonas sediminis]